MMSLVWNYSKVQQETQQRKPTSSSGILQADDVNDGDDDKYIPKIYNTNNNTSTKKLKQTNTLDTLNKHNRW